MNVSETLGGAVKAAEKAPGLRALIVFGSRATGDAHAESDWDFAYVADVDLDREALREAMASALAVSPDQVDLVDAVRANAALKFEIARDGVVVFERDAAGEDFVVEAVRTWLDMEPVLTPAYRELLQLA